LFAHLLQQPLVLVSHRRLHHLERLAVFAWRVLADFAVDPKSGAKVVDRPERVIQLRAGLQPQLPDEEFEHRPHENRCLQALVGVS
jgi:hypothetical protein